MRDIFSKLDKYEIKIRKAVNSHLHGNFNSIFKGTGLEFADLRTYQYGDDVRTIDWITTAKGHGAYVKIFKEEKEQTVFFLLDVSGSQKVGAEGKMKIDRAKEVCGVLALSAIKESSSVGLYCFSDQKELYLKPETGINFAYKFVLKLFGNVPKSSKTNIRSALGFALDVLKKKSVIILISDFLDENYIDNLRALAKKHDLVIIQLYDKRENSLPNLGIIPIIDRETNSVNWINTSSKTFKSQMHNSFKEKGGMLQKISRQYKTSYLSISADEDFVPRLIELFRIRK